MFVVCCLALVAVRCWLMFVVRCVLRAGCFGVWGLAFGGCWLMAVVCRLVFVVCCVLRGWCCWRWSLSVVVVARCALCAACRLLVVIVCICELFVACC